MLLFSNLPHNYSEIELQAWIESKGIPTLSVRIVRDSAGGISPAFGDVEVPQAALVGQAIALLNGTRIRDRVIHVREAATSPVRVERIYLGRKTRVKKDRVVADRAD